MQELKEAYVEWTGFVDSREAERARVTNPPGAKELRDRINDKKGEVLKAQAELQMLKAELILTGNGEVPYLKSDFDYQWARKKADLKAKVETLIAEQLEHNVTVPKIMRELNCKNPTWLYAVKENLNAHRGAAKEGMAQTDWHWSDVTAVHRYALGYPDNGSEWAFVLMHGAVESEYEHEQCMFDYVTGNFIAGNRGLFNSVTDGVKAQRSKMLAEILDGVYVKKVRRDSNPYFTAE